MEQWTDSARLMDAIWRCDSAGCSENVTKRVPN